MYVIKNAHLLYQDNSRIIEKLSQMEQAIGWALHQGNYGEVAQITKRHEKYSRWYRINIFNNK